MSDLEVTKQDYLNRIVGLPVDVLLDVKKKLDVLGITIEDIQDYLTYDKIQLLAKQTREIALLKGKLREVEKIVRGYYDGEDKE